MMAPPQENQKTNDEHCKPSKSAIEAMERAYGSKWKEVAPVWKEDDGIPNGTPNENDD